MKEYEIQFEKVEIKATTRKLSGNWTCEISPYIIYGFTNEDGDYEEIEIHKDELVDRSEFMMLYTKVDKSN